MDALARRNWASVALLELCVLDPTLHPHHVLRAVFWLASCTRVERRIHVASPGLENYELLGAAPKHEVVVGRVQARGPQAAGGRRKVTVEDAGWAAQPVSVLSCAFPHCLTGTGGPSRPASGWVGTEPPGSPPTGTAAISPRPSGTGGGTLRPLSSTTFPGSSGQPQSSPRASSTQTGANHVMLHPRDVTGDSISPSLTASPAMDSALGGELYWPSDLFYSFKKTLYSFCLLETEKMLCFACAVFAVIWVVG